MTNFNDQPDIETDLFGLPLQPEPMQPKSVATGVQKVIEVDPGDCRIWGGNPRHLARLNVASTTELRASIVAAGGQQIAAIARPCEGSDAKYEVIVGARRHWCICWLLNHGYSDLTFKLEVRDLTDAECFQLCTLENQDRRNVSEYETALSLKSALADLYDGHQGNLASAIGKDGSWVSRRMKLAELPVCIPNAYTDWSALKITHVPKITKVLKSQGETILQRARDMAAEHLRRDQAGVEPLSEFECFQMLTTGKTRPTKTAGPRKAVKKTKSETGDVAKYGPKRNPHLVLSTKSADKLVITVPRNTKATATVVLASIEKCLNDHLGKQ
jgi:ParB/RepB/Spo0J family partition protein